MKHKRGDTFNYVAVLPDTVADGEFADRVPTCQIRDVLGRLVADVAIDWIDPVTARSLSLQVADTTKWVLGNSFFDIQFTRTSDGDIRSTDTMPLNVIEDITRP